VLQQRRTAHKTGVKLGYKLFAAQICAGYQKVCSQEKFQQASGKVENQPDSRDPQHVTVIINSKSFHTHTHESLSDNMAYENIMQTHEKAKQEYRC